MPGINSFGAMGGMSSMGVMYQNLAANRRQSPMELPQDASGEQQQATGLSALNARPAPSQMPMNAQATALPTEDSLNDATNALSQMRVQFSDPADAAFERFQAEGGLQNLSAMPQVPPAEEEEDEGLFSQGLSEIAPPPPMGGAAPTDGMGMSRMQAAPARDAQATMQASAQAMSQMVPPPENNLPAQMPDVQAKEGTAAPLAVAAGIA